VLLAAATALLAFAHLPCSTLPVSSGPEAWPGGAL
jgi:hypothetical protein